VSYDGGSMLKEMRKEISMKKAAKNNLVSCVA
jgi:hypothetical protein